MEWHDKLWPKFGNFAETFFEQACSIVDDDEYARHYVRMFAEAELAKILRQLALVGKPYDISIASADDHLDRITKRLTLVADHSILSHAGGARVELDSGNSFERVVEFSANVPDLAALGRYLRDSEKMLGTSRLIYLPNFILRRRRPDTSVPMHSGVTEPEIKTYENIADLVVSGQHVVDAVGNESKRRLVEPMLVVELPYLEGTNLSDFFAICLEESEAFAVCQDYLRKKLLSVKPSDDSSHVDIRLLEIEIRDGIRALEGELKRLQSKSAVQITGAGLATVTAALFPLTLSELAKYVTPIVGLSGGAWAVLAAAEESNRNRRQIKGSPYYLLWLFSRKAKRM